MPRMLGAESEEVQVPLCGVTVLRAACKGVGGQSWEVLVGDGLGFVGGDDVEAAAGQDVEAEVAASFGPLVGLLGQDPS